jgi:hypothetical protein
VVRQQNTVRSPLTASGAGDKGDPTV